MLAGEGATLMQLLDMVDIVGTLGFQVLTMAEGTLPHTECSNQEVQDFVAVFETWYFASAAMSSAALIAKTCLVFIIAVGVEGQAMMHISYNLALKWCSVVVICIQNNDLYGTIPYLRFVFEERRNPK